MLSGLRIRKPRPFTWFLVLVVLFSDFILEDFLKFLVTPGWLFTFQNGAGPLHLETCVPGGLPCGVSWLGLFFGEAQRSVSLVPSLWLIRCPRQQSFHFLLLEFWEPSGEEGRVRRQGRWVSACVTCPLACPFCCHYSIPRLRCACTPSPALYCREQPSVFCWGAWGRPRCPAQRVWRRHVLAKETCNPSPLFRPYLQLRFQSDLLPPVLTLYEF